MLQLVSYPLRTVLAVVKPGRLPWLGLWLPKMASAWPDLGDDLRPLRIHWGRVLLLAILLFVAMGEVGPVASVIATLP